VPSNGVCFAAANDVVAVPPETSPACELVLDIYIPDVDISVHEVGGEAFSSVRLAGYGWTSETGFPQLPVKGFLLEIPEGALPSVEVVQTDRIVSRGDRVLPVATCTADLGIGRTYQQLLPDPVAYSMDCYYPDRIAEVGFCGYLRDVRVAQLKVFPVQYNAARQELRIHRRIRLRVSLTNGEFMMPPGGQRRSADASNPFDTIYDNVIMNFGTGSAGRMSDPAVTDGFSSPAISLPTCLKVQICEDGIYEIGFDDLKGAGLDLSAVEPAAIKMFSLGTEIPILVSGQSDGVFDATDRIKFFGLGDGGQYSAYNTYWLSFGGATGLRMSDRFAAPGDSLPVPASLPHTIHFEPDNEYYANVFEGEGKDHWFWEELPVCCPRDYVLDLSCVAAVSGDARVTIGLRGKTSFDHHLSASVNGNPIADLIWAGMVEYEGSFGFSQAYLTEGENQLHIEYASSSWDRVYLNWVEIEYERDLVAHEDQIRFEDSQQEREQFRIEGFSTGQIEVFEITDPNGVVRLADCEIVSEPSGYAVVFEGKEAQQEYLAVSTRGTKRPASIGRYVPALLRSPARGADYVVITCDEFKDAVQPLAALRESEGLQVEVVDITDIYDEFGHGNPCPNAVKDFLTYAYYNWHPAPSFVLLAGDASYDSKGNIPGSKRDIVPTHLFISQTEYLETCCDDWFGCVVGDDPLADMLVGRLPAQDEAALGCMVEKIIEYETSLEEGSWRGGVLLAADDPDHGGDFEAVCERFVEGYLAPAGLDVVKAYVSECGTACRDRILAGFDEGCVICNYVGHGALDIWAVEQILRSSDVDVLNNVGRFPVVVAFTCLNGFFHHATADSCLAECFVGAPDKGAVAFWCHSGFNYTSPSEVLGQALYDALLNDGNHILGSAIQQAKVEYLATSPYFWDQAPMLILFGDPALEIGFEGKPDALPGSVTFRPRRPVEAAEDTIEAIVFNAGRADMTDLRVRFTVGHPDSSSSDIVADKVTPQVKAGEHVTIEAVWDCVADAGTYAVYVEVDPDNEITESCEWNNTCWESLRVCCPDDTQDVSPPEICIYVDGSQVGVEFFDGDYAPECPMIEAVFSDTASGIDTDALEVLMNSEPIHGIEILSGWLGSSEVTIGCPLGPLGDGTYSLSVTVADCSCRSNRAQAGVRLVVESELLMHSIGTCPNPWLESTALRYSLSQQADDVRIEIYSVTGRLIRTVNRAPAARNQNSWTWDGTNEHGDPVGGGVYFYRIQALRNGTEQTTTGKTIIIR
jgi:hypothetical protein